MAERRVDPVDGSAYTYEELKAYYKSYKKKQIDEYWEYTCTPVKGKQKAKQKADTKKKTAVEEPEATTASSGALQESFRKTAASRKSIGNVFLHNFTNRNEQIGGKLEDKYEVNGLRGQAMINHGEGAFGQVVEGLEKNSQKHRAIKCMNLSQIQDKAKFELEITIQQELSHPNICKLFETFKDAKNIYLIMELCKGGTLYSWLDDPDCYGFGEECSASYMLQLVSAVNYLHATKHLVHRDIKPDNILLLTEDENTSIKLIDFGAARRYTPGSGPTMTTLCGTYAYLAPEALLTSEGKKKGYDEKCDIWSCGVLLFYMIAGDEPFGGTEGELKRKVRAGKIDLDDDAFDEVSDEGKDVIQKMMTFNPADRLSADALLKHKWFDTYAPHPTVDLAKDLPTRLQTFKASSKLKRLVLSIIAKNLSSTNKDAEKIKQMFEALDVNGDGTVALAEMRTGLEKQGIAIPADFDEIFSYCDTDDSGEIDYHEFLAAAMEESTYKRSFVIENAFNSLDANRDGVISKDDVAALLGDATGSESAAVKAMFDGKPNRDRDTIDLDEFRSLFGEKSTIRDLRSSDSLD